MEISKLIESFKRTKMAQTTEETQRFYRDHLKSVEQWIQDVGLKDINDITADMVNDYIIDLKADGLSQKTINNRLGIIKQLIKLRLLPYEYTKEQNIIMQGIMARPTDPEHYPALTREQFSKFLRYVEKLDENKPIRSFYVQEEHEDSALGYNGHIVRNVYYSQLSPKDIVVNDKLEQIWPEKIKTAPKSLNEILAKTKEEIKQR